jgi:hypothetical protein
MPNIRDIAISIEKAALAGSRAGRLSVRRDAGSKDAAGRSLFAAVATS